MSKELAGKTVAFLVANDGVEQVELTQPWRAVRDAGGKPATRAIWTPSGRLWSQPSPADRGSQLVWCTDCRPYTGVRIPAWRALSCSAR